jgi:GTP cyclohydrolase I
VSIATTPGDRGAGQNGIDDRTVGEAQFLAADDVLSDDVQASSTGSARDRPPAGAKNRMTSNNGHVAGLALAAPLAGRSGPREIDHPRAQHAARDLLLALGADVESSGLRDTPRRMAAAYAELLTPQPFRATTFPTTTATTS